MGTSRFLKISAIACFAAMFFASAAEAQPPGGGRGPQGGQRGQRGAGQQRGGGGAGGQQRGGFTRGGFGGRGGGPTLDRATLLSSDQVKDELQLNEASGATIDAALDAYREEQRESRPDFSGIRDLEEKERTELFAKMQKDREALSKKTDEVLNALLEPEQKTRLDQIAFQIKVRTGLLAMLKTDDMKKKLSITDEQLAKLEENEKAAEAAQNKMREEMRAAFQGGGERPDFTEMQKKMEAVRAEGLKHTMAVLSDVQNSKIEEMKGKPFELDMRSLRGSRGGFGAPGRGGRGGEGGGGDAGGRRRPGGGGGERRRPAADDDPV